MTAEPEQFIADIVSAAGGRLVSRIRMQKIAYLLDQLGAGSGFSYSYHHYGPFSREVDSAVLDAEAFNLITERIARRLSDGAPYSIFETDKVSGNEKSCVLFNDLLCESVKEWSKVPATVLELAATAHWLSEYEKVDSWRDEIVRRKGSKTNDGRLEKAIDLLREAKLPPAVESD